MCPAKHCYDGARLIPQSRTENYRDPQNVVSEAVDNPFALLLRLRDDDSPLHEVHVHPGISEVASVLVDACDSPGIEPFQLEFLLRTVIYLDRLERSASVSAVFKSLPPAASSFCRATI
jgi:hypothetical protein